MTKQELIAMLAKVPDDCEIQIWPFASVSNARSLTLEVLLPPEGDFFPGVAVLKAHP